MRRVCRIGKFTAVLALASAATTADAASLCGSPGARMLHSVVRVSGSNGVAASGVVIEHGRVLTAAHVVEPLALLRVRQADGSPRPATLVASDAGSDLALLAVDTRGLDVVDIAHAGLRPGERVWAAGYPRDGNLTVSTGLLQSPRNGRLRADAFVDSGQSGGALLRCSATGYRLAGIVHGYLARVGRHGLSNTGESLAIDIPAVRRFLAVHGGAESH